MYSPLELPDAAGSSPAAGRRWPAAGSRAWPRSLFGRGATGFAAKPNGGDHRRRPNGSPICHPCHLPLLIVWTLVVILVLHKLTSNAPDQDTLAAVAREVENFEEQTGQLASQLRDSDNSVDYPESTEPTTQTKRKQLAHKADDEFKQNVAFTKPIKSSDNNELQQGTLRATASASTETSQIQPEAHTTGRPLLTTKKSIVSDFARQAKVFILIVQNELFHARASFKRETANGQQSTSFQANNEAGGGGGGRHFRIPNHIRHVMDILDYHRIGYELDTTQFGLPTQLLADREGKHFSVIIIDNFYKYTRLNRWLRDQLDRHCRLNQVGVITYLRYVDDLLDSSESQLYFKAKNHSHLLSQRSVRSSSTTAKTMTEEFPLLIKPIKQDCRNVSSRPSSCLIDYQVSERTPVLRVLKRKPDFVLPGELDAAQSPWTTISSNHITYEPITWAKFRKAPPAATRAARRAHSDDEPPNASRRQLWPAVERAPRDNRTQSGDRSGIARPEIMLRKRAANPLGYGARAPGEQLANALDKQQLGTTAGKQSDAPAHDLNYSSRSSSVSGSMASGARISGAGDDPGPVPAPPTPPSSDDGDEDERQVLSVLDRGLYDGIKRVIFGFTNEHWLNRILLLDAVEHMSSGQIISPLDRFIQIDIDDMFVGERGTRLSEPDVENLIETQRSFARLIDGGFQFNLGFSGKYFKHGLEHENRGDEALVANAKQFAWFCHFWSHSKAHLFNTSEAIANELRKNLEFARAKRLPLIGQAGDWFATSPGAKLQPSYAVAPHHSGVYPVHEQLYEAWTDVLNVRVTSTEEYPHLRPAGARRAFVHKTITVLPRQTCGLYTHTIYRRKYPGGFGKLLASIRGGELFRTVLHNPVNIYMTHMSNYAHDRLAPLAFADLFAFVRDNTNLHLRFWPSGGASRDLGAPASAPPPTTASKTNQSRPWPLGPMNLAQYYLSLYPNEREPLWTNPCDDKRHLAIWPARHQADYCPVVPRLLVVGPQKTGTTALYTFLKMSAVFRTSAIAPAADFEELQFFNDKHYHRGIGWYLGRLSGGQAEATLGPAQAAAAAMIHNDGGNGDDDDVEPEEDDYASGGVELAADGRLDDSGPAAAAASAAPDLNGEPSAGLAGEFVIYFDKSATYFDDPKAARRANALAPDAKIVILLIDPADRAHSWYQHARAHGDQAANLLSFEQLVAKLDSQRNSSSSLVWIPPASDHGRPVALDASQLRQATALRQRCLQPGHYAQHLANWLNYYAPRQIIIVDGEWLAANPAAVMNRLQLLLHVPGALRLDYAQRLVYVKQKGFYCEKVRPSQLGPSNSRQESPRRAAHKCLGPSKGRRYPPMSNRARGYLRAHFRQSNRQLARLLADIGQPLPRWLRAADDGESRLI